jgi:hypothetical protein
VGVRVARINVEDQLFTDQRWLDLVIKLQDPDKALGALVRAWRVGQEYWKQNRHGIPKSVWKTQKLNDAIVDVGLAEDRGEFIKIWNSEKHFAWIEQKVTAGQSGGKESGKARLKTPKKSGKRNEAEASVAKRSEPSSSLSLSPSVSSSISSSKTKDIASGPSGTVAPSKSGPTWEAYADAYQGRYGIAPVRNATVNAQLAALVKRLGEGEAPQVAAFYVRHPDQFYGRSMHPVGLLLKDAEKLRTEWATGRRMTTSEARTLDKTQATLDAADRAYEKYKAARDRKESGRDPEATS